MPYFTSDGYVYLKENDKKPKNHHKSFILKQEPQFTTTLPVTSILILLEKNEIATRNFC